MKVSRFSVAGVIVALGMSGAAVGMAASSSPAVARPAVVSTTVYQPTPPIADQNCLMDMTTGYQVCTPNGGS